MQKARHAPGEKKLGYAGLCKLLTEWRNSADTRWPAKARGQPIHARRDCLHPISTALSQNHAVVCIEDWPLQNMSQSAAGTAEQPGKNVRAKSGLNKSILVWSRGGT
ncbi:MAG: hypothetical protein Q6K81_05945, partial [Gloeomargarita sp. DG02_5_bins_242]